MKYITLILSIMLISPSFASTGFERIERVLDRRMENRFEDVKSLPSGEQRRINNLLEQSFRVLSTGSTSAIRDRIKRLQDEARLKREEKASALMSVASAPPAPSGIFSSLIRVISPPDQQTYRDRAAAAESRIKEIEVELSSLRNEFRTELGKIGIVLTASQIEAVLTLVTVDDLIGVRATFESIKSIQQSLQTAMGQNTSNLELARRYYGMHVVLLEVAMFGVNAAVDRIDSGYMPRLQSIRAENRRLMEDTNRLISSANRSNLPVLERNRDAQRLTERAGSIYETRMLEEKRRLESTRAQLESQHSIAMNTWRTVQAASDLAEMLREGGKQFDAIAGIEVPPLVPFDSPALGIEFERLGQRLGSPTS